MNDISRGGIKVMGMTDDEMEFQLLRQLGASSYKASSVGECLAIANQTSTANPSDWVNAFSTLGEWQKKDGLMRLNQNRIVSGREQLFKACNSFRAAEYYTSCLSEEHRRFGLKSVDCFITAISTQEVHFETHEISYKNIHIPAYFISPQNDGVKRKTLLIVSGFDGTLEEEWFMRGWAGVERDYNVILFAGPGQMDIFRQTTDTWFEPDFEAVVARVIDHFEHRHEVNMDTLALLGVSIGGYFATRAASHEPRIKALVANSPVLDVFSYCSSFVDFDPSELPDADDFTLEDLPHIPENEFPVSLKAMTEQLMIRYGRHSFKNTFLYLKEFIVGEALTNLRCPSLALIGSKEGREPRRQFDEFCQTVNADKYEFSDFEGASMHCQVGNVTFANAVMYDWLDELS